MPALVTGVDNDDKYRTLRVGDDGHLGSSKSIRQKVAGTISGPFSYIFTHTPTVATITSPNMSGDTANIPFPAGSQFRVCSATSITVVSGDLTAYYV